LQQKKEGRGMEDDTRKLLRSVSRDHFHFIWENAKNNDLEDLDEDEKRLAKIMLMHEDEFFNEFEFADVLNEREYDPETESNPFLHIVIHDVIENQIRNRDPIESVQFYNAMRNKKYPHHDTIHLIGAILAPFFFEIIQTKEPFDQNRYISLLKKYKSRKPEKIWSLIESEF
jgi:hypothetical protein